MTMLEREGFQVVREASDGQKPRMGRRPLVCGVAPARYRRNGYQHAHLRWGSMLHGTWAVHFPKTKTILLTQHDERQYIREALEAEVPWRTIPFQRPPCREAGRLHVGNTCPEGQWTVFAEAFDDDSMGTTSPTHRRSGRAFHRMRVEAHGRAHNGKKFKEACETVVVNAHGGLLMLKHEIDNGEMIVLMNPETLEEQECRVVYQGEPCEKGQRIGVEFLTPAPRFWGLEFGELSTPAGGGDATAVH